MKSHKHKIVFFLGKLKSYKWTLVLKLSGSRNLVLGFFHIVEFLLPVFLFFFYVLELATCWFYTFSLFNGVNFYKIFPLEWLQSYADTKTFWYWIKLRHSVQLYLYTSFICYLCKRTRISMLMNSSGKVNPYLFDGKLIPSHLMCKS